MKKRLGLDKKITITTVILTNLIVIILSIVAIFLSQNYISVANEQKVMNALEGNASKLDYWVKIHEQSIKTAGQTLVYEKIDLNTTKKILKDVIDDSNGAMFDVYFANPKVNIIYGSGVPIAEGYDSSQRGWYKDAVAANGASICTAPYIDAITGELVITIASAIYDNNGDFYGVIGADAYITQLIEQCQAIEIYENSYPFLMDNETNMLVHKNEEFGPKIEGEDVLFTKVEDIPSYAALEAGKVSILKDYDGNKVAVGLVTLPDLGWNLGYAIDYGVYSEMLSAMIKSLAVLLVLAIIVTIVVSLFTIKRCLNPIDELQVVAKQMGNGNLNYESQYNGNDSVGLLCENLALTNNALKGYIGDISTNLESVARGEFNIQFNANYVGDFAPIKKSIQEISQAMKKTIDGIRVTSNDVTDKAELFSMNSSALAADANTQASILNQMNEIVERVTNNTKENGQSAKQVQELSRDTRHCVDSSNDSMKQLLNSMDEITDMSNQIGKIIKTIDDIAFQTNILALNAAVEAARAGAAGKGFVVVADEVRNLAGKSAEAAKNTTALIQNTSKAVEKGLGIANVTAQSLDEVTGQTKKVNEFIENISKICELQIEDIQTINQQLESALDVVNKNNKTAEQTAASSQELSAEAQILKQLVDNFGKDNQF